MSLLVINPGVQATLQGAPRLGRRHLGVPTGGPADPLSMALANRLVGHSNDATAIEVTFGGAAFRFNAPASFALAGAPCNATLAGRAIETHHTYVAAAGDELAIAPARQGCRLYLAISAEIEADTFLGSTSTYLPAKFGGYGGRALKTGDAIKFGESRPVASVTTPDDLRPVCSNSYAIRAVDGPDLPASSKELWENAFTVTQRANRMGIELDGNFPKSSGDHNHPSSAIFPGALQLPASGRGFLLLADAQTTGGYPHIMQVIRADRHLLGQLRPGDRVRFLHRTHQQAAEALYVKQSLFEDWLPDFSL